MKDYTVKEIAELLEVSKPTVQKVINDLELQFITKGKRDRLYSQENVLKVIKAINPNFDFSKIIENIENNANESQKPKKDTEKTENQTENTEKNEKIEDLQNLLIETLQKQIEDQQEQMRTKDQEINNLHRLLEQQQVLTLQAHQKIELLETKQEEPKEIYEKSWFGLFKKVKK